MQKRHFHVQPDDAALNLSQVCKREIKMQKSLWRGKKKHSFSQSRFPPRRSSWILVGGQEQADVKWSPDVCQSPRYQGHSWVGRTSAQSCISQPYPLSKVIQQPDGREWGIGKPGEMENQPDQHEVPLPKQGLMCQSRAQMVFQVIREIKSPAFFNPRTDRLLKKKRREGRKGLRRKRKPEREKGK